MAIMCRCFRVQRAIAHPLAVDSLSSNSRNDGMQKGMPERITDHWIGGNLQFHFSAGDSPNKFKRYSQCDQLLDLLVRMRREVARARPDVAPRLRRRVSDLTVRGDTLRLPATYWSTATFIAAPISSTPYRLMSFRIDLFSMC
jgi:hypothetical protein